MELSTEACCRYCMKGVREKKREQVGKGNYIFLGGDRREKGSRKKCLSVWKNRMHDIYNISSRTYQWRYTDL